MTNKNLPPMHSLSAEFAEAFEFLKAKLNGVVPEIAMILGSGLGFFADTIEDKIEIPFTTVPHFPGSTVVGHKGQFVVGKLHGKTVICMQGRIHFYEGNTMSQVVAPVRLMKKLGCSKLIVTNAAGGVNSNFVPGTLMVITDHINNMAANPLIGENDDSFGPRFPDMSKTYSKRLIDIALQMKGQIEADLQTGVYMANSGPTYETPAEIRFMRTVGADAVGMSTVPETIIANHAGMEIVGISCITNLAAGMQDSLNHEEVTETARRVSGSFVKVLDHIVKNIDA